MDKEAFPIKRIERKYLVAPQAQEFILAYLRHATLPDRSFPMSRVASVYYDTPDLAAYEQSADGDVYKQKVRIRWYGYPSRDRPEQVYLEMKAKLGWHTLKRRKPLWLPGAVLAEGAPAAMVGQEVLEGALREWDYTPQAELFPVVFISYHRHRFRDLQHNLSLNYDVGIACALLRDGVLQRAQVEFPTTVLEIKGDTLAFPPTLRGLERFLSPWTAFSKYVAGLELSLLTGGPRVWPSPSQGPRVFQSYKTEETYAITRLPAPPSP